MSFYLTDHTSSSDAAVKKILKGKMPLDWILEPGVKTEPNFEDPKFKDLCIHCGSNAKLVYSFKNLAGKDTHSTRCLRCKRFLFVAPFCYSARDLPNMEIPFGKFKGKRLSEVDPSYLAWCVEKMKTTVFLKKVKEYLANQTSKKTPKGDL